MPKRLSALLLALIFALALSACGEPAAGSPSSEIASLPVASSPEESPAVPEPGSDEAEGPAVQPQETAPAETEDPMSQPLETAPAETEDPASQPPDTQDTVPAVTEDGYYSSKEEVALYIHLYGRLPDNYITKKEAQDLGWTGGSVERCAGEGTAIGGSRFGNYEGLLPEAAGRTYTECDIDTVGRSSRGGKRLVFSNDGLIYYTGDHYGSFELLYGET